MSSGSSDLRRSCSLSVFLLFLASIVSQGVLPLVHFRDVDAKEAAEHSCKGHPKSHTERDPGPSHHDSAKCPVCQIIQASQPTLIQSFGTAALLTESTKFVPLGFESPEVRGPPLSGSSPRAPPQPL